MEDRQRTPASKVINWRETESEPARPTDSGAEGLHSAPVSLQSAQKTSTNLGDRFFFYSSAVVNCGLLDPPKDGRVSFTSTSYTAVAVYVCFPGYRLEGVEERTCQANGEWSDEEPSCESEHSLITLTIFHWYF